ncbi:hypothetical protein D0868_12882 [Hortaea werneckii]|uniref:Uncharacterized protein n=1 Tax=Hortaea werneckii TaxID=91943 RepID=A0A3M6XRR4_HORWE|nr:hypothetical protein D0868_12882 [Hortaea werneckii]
MAEIYSGAYIVFVAAAAADVEGGLDISADLKDWRHLTEHQVRAGSICEPANLCSPLGAVHHGTLTLRGFCVWVNVQHLGGNSPAHFDKLSIISNEFEFHVALRLDYSLKTGDRFQDLLPERLSEAHVMPRARVEKRGVPEMPVQLLYLTRNIFLVLSSSTRKHGAYFRTGILSLIEDLVNRDEANKTNVRKQLLSAANREEVVVV